MSLYLIVGFPVRRVDRRVAFDVVVGAMVVVRIVAFTVAVDIIGFLVVVLVLVVATVVVVVCLSVVVVVVVSTVVGGIHLSPGDFSCLIGTIAGSKVVSRASSLLKKTFESVGCRMYSSGFSGSFSFEFSDCGHSSIRSNDI